MSQIAIVNESFIQDATVGMAGEAAGSESEYPAWYRAMKLTVDFVAALLLLSLTGPLILLLMGLVKLTSRGPALYSQVRLGRDGRPYRIYKIRTMIHDCERLTGPRWSQAGDPRITPLGRWLRRTHLDELPQLANVLRCEMSLVGPRPERPEIASQLEKTFPDYRKRLLVRPGITGLSQVQLPADVDLFSVRRKLRCDLCYIQKMGPWLDLRILAATGLKVLGVPFGVTRMILGLPGHVDAESSRIWQTS
ncbi:MAG TPA: sugar transferase [Isosphaeraceae bacterium]|jgi:lipopolysaccharide/colanic/teichoic acid biosynthesis glycosyltransferase